MTQIKLRRDTSANFTSSNPILGNGEPAYETDTKKLKIGDGTTAYTQLEYFSAGGGGGSTNISATLPLKIVDGVISLEVDGQTIQIVDGKLHANLDELGNEVNGLSGRVTAAEGEVAKKEDEITAIKPITLEKKVISSLKGMSYTSDGTRLYAQSITNLATENNWNNPHITYNNPVSYIDIPIDVNKDQVITIPRFNTTYSISEAVTFVLGSYDANGLFYPIFFQAKGNSNNGSCWLISNNYPEAVGTTYLNGSPTRGSSFGALNISSDKVYIQAKYDESSGFYIRTFGAYPGDSSSEGLQIVYTSPTDIERLKQITACRFINMGKMNTASTAVLATLFGRYDGTHLERGTLPDLTNIPNSFSLTDIQSLNYLELNLGDGLSVVDGKLTASSTAPTNMVTTDTTQTITGNKTFKYIGIDDAYGGKTRLGNGQSKIEMAYDGQISLDSATILADQSQNWRVGRYNKAGLIYSASPLKRVGDGPTFTNYDILDSSNLGSYVDGTTITYTNNKLSATGGGSAPSNMVTTDTAQTITGRKTFGDKIVFNRPDYDAQEQSSILGGEFKLGTSNYNNSIYANSLTLSANTTNEGTFKVQSSSTQFTQINGATITSQRPSTGAYKIINTIRPSGASSNKNYSVLYSEVDDSYNHKLTVNNLSSDLVLAGKTVKDGSGNKFLTSGNVTAYVTEEFVDGTEGYRVWSNGRCEQWGSFGGIKSITFLKSYADTNYMLLAYVTSKTSGEAYNGVFGTAKTTTGFTTGGFAGTLNDAWIINACGTVNWYASGILAP